MPKKSSRGSGLTAAIFGPGSATAQALTRVQQLSYTQSWGVLGRYLDSGIDRAAQYHRQLADLGTGARAASDRGQAVGALRKLGGQPISVGLVELSASSDWLCFLGLHDRRRHGLRL